MNTTPQYSLAHVPFLRLVVPLVVGIIWQHFRPAGYLPAIFLVVGFVLAVVAFWVRRDPFSTLYRYTFSASFMAVMVAVGMFSYRYAQPHEELPPMADGAVAVARIEEMPVARQYTLQARAVVVAVSDSSGVTQEVDVPLLLYLQPNYTATRLQRGDLVLFQPQLRRISSAELPYAFDYAAYMRRQGILYSQYLADGSWRLSSHTDRLALRDRAQHVQRRCVESIGRLGLSPENSALLSAIVWGYKQDIPATVRDYFSAAGLSHVLAVSGLHTGIIAFLLWLLFYPLRYTRLRPLQTVFTLVLLWVYAFITGLSPSVVRACIMATFVGVARLLHRHNTTLNALLGAALITLLFAPAQLFDVGFQLSYTAVIGIVLLAPYLDIARLMECRSTPVRYVSGLLAVSLSAQTATTLLAAYYFHYIPVWGVLANLFLVPLLPLPVLFTLCTQLLEVLHLPYKTIAVAADAITTLLVDGANSIAQLPGAVIEGVWVTLPILACSVVLLLCLWQMFMRRNLKPLPVALVAIIVMQGVVLYEQLRPVEATAFVAAEQRHTVMQLLDEERHCIILATDTTHAEPRAGREMRMRYRAEWQMATVGDTLATTHIYVALPFVRYYDKTLLWVDEESWRGVQADVPYAIDCAVVTERYRGKIADLLRNFAIGEVILSPALYPARALQLQEECDQAGIPCHDIKNAVIWL